MTDDCSVPPSESPESETTNISTSSEDAAPRHLSKAESNRENAKRSTGPRTEKGKANSRLNALKHGILAAQTVVATLEGPEQRKMFDQTVEGLDRGILLKAIDDLAKVRNPLDPRRPPSN